MRDKSCYFMKRRPQYHEKTGEKIKDSWIEMYCPKCNTVSEAIRIDETSIIKCSKCGSSYDCSVDITENARQIYIDQQYNMFYVKHNIFNSDYKMTVSVLFKLVNIFKGKLVVKYYNGRITYNLKTGMTYTFPYRVINKGKIDNKEKTNKTKPAFLLRQTHMLNESYMPTIEHMWRIPEEEKNNIREKLRERIMETHQLSEKMLDLESRDQTNLINRFPNLSKEKTEELLNLFRGKRNSCHRKIRGIKPDFNKEEIESYILKSLNIPKKKRLVSMIMNNYELGLHYHEIRRCGITNYDNVLRILEATKKCTFTNGLISDYICFDDISPIIHVKYFQEKHMTKESIFTRKYLLYNPEAKLVRNIINHNRNFRDTAHMFSSVYRVPEIAEQVTSKEFLTRTMKEIHDDLVIITNDLWYKNKGKNVKIKYNDHQKKLSDKINGYTFVLPKDTSSLIFIGRELHNCVGSYKAKVLNQDSTIVAVRKQNKTIACLGIDQNMNLVQAKLIYNKPVEGEIVPTIIKWLDKNTIKDESRDIIPFQEIEVQIPKEKTITQNPTIFELEEFNIPKLEEPIIQEPERPILSSDLNFSVIRTENLIPF